MTLGKWYTCATMPESPTQIHDYSLLKLEIHLAILHGLNYFQFKGNLYIVIFP